MKERLDKGVANIQCRLIFLEAIVENNSPYGSNHGPILLNLEPKRKFMHRSFRFEWMWTEDSKCREQINYNWKRTNSEQKLVEVRNNIIYLTKKILKNGIK